MNDRPLQRLLRTFVFVELALNGTSVEKDQLTVWLTAMHRRVGGSLDDETRSTFGLNDDSDETTYGYTEELKAFVLLTLIYSTITFEERYGRQMTERGRDHIVLHADFESAFLGYNMRWITRYIMWFAWLVGSYILVCLGCLFEVLSLYFAFWSQTCGVVLTTLSTIHNKTVYSNASKAFYSKDVGSSGYLERLGRTSPFTSSFHLTTSFLQIVLLHLLSAQVSDYSTLTMIPYITLLSVRDACSTIWSDSLQWIVSRRCDLIRRSLCDDERYKASIAYPLHVGCIMDGNRRFARARDRPVGVGHAKGAEIALQVILWWIKTASTSQGGCPSTLTLWAFSSDNFKRGVEEVSGLFSLMESEFKELALTPLVHMFRIRVRVIGSSTARSKFPSRLLNAINIVEMCTATYGASHPQGGLDLLLAVGYGGRDEIVEAVQRIAEIGGAVDERSITQGTYCAQLGVPPVDLIIRTSERRTSGFMLWDTLGAELHFIDKLWPELDETDWLRALQSFASRQQRRGA